MLLQNPVHFKKIEEIRRKMKNQRTQKNKKQVLETEMGNLKDELTKKKSLIKILENKCAKNIIKSTQKHLVQIKMLEIEKQELQKKLQKLSSERKDELFFEINTKQPKYKFFNIEELCVDSLKKIVLLQFSEMDNLLRKIQNRDQKIQQYQKYNKELRKSLLEKMKQVQILTFVQVENVEVLSLSDSCQNIKLTNSKDDLKKSKHFKKGHRASRSFSQMKSDVTLSKEKVLIDKQMQTQMLYSLQIQELRKENEGLKEYIQRSDYDMEQMRQEISFLTMKIQQFYEEMEIPQTKQEGNDEYTEVLELFSIDRKDENHHSKLLKQFNEMKQNMQNLIQQIKKGNKKIQQIHRQNQNLFKSLDKQKHKNFSLSTFIDEINQEIMKDKLRQLIEKSTKELIDLQ